MTRQCRTCKQQITSNEYFYVNGSSLVSSGLQVQDLLLSLVPEFDADLVPNSAICRNCMSTLHIAYAFKEQIKKNEDGLRMPDVQPPLLLVDAKALNAYVDTGVERKPRVANRTHRCAHCDFSTDNKACLATHVRIHSGEKPYRCSQCDYQAKRKAHLQAHVANMHTEHERIPCPLCDKHFSNMTNLLKHQRTHSNEKPYRCVMCDFKSVHRSSVLNHIRRLHVGVALPPQAELSVCSVCGKSFSRQSSLNVHMRIHTGVKSLLCELCGKHFREKGVLNNHLLTHKEGTFKCGRCSYTANRRDHLRQHEQIYGDHEELFYCVRCPNFYANSFNLTKHVREAHADMASKPHRRT